MYIDKYGKLRHGRHMPCASKLAAADAVACRIGTVRVPSCALTFGHLTLCFFPESPCQIILSHDFWNMVHIFEPTFHDLTKYIPLSFRKKIMRVIYGSELSVVILFNDDLRAVQKSENEIIK